MKIFLSFLYVSDDFFSRLKNTLFFDIFDLDLDCEVKVIWHESKAEGQGNSPMSES